MSQGRRHFTDEFKREAVALLVSSGRPLSRIASELGISASMLRNWRNGSGGRDDGVEHGGVAAVTVAANADMVTTTPSQRRTTGAFALFEYGYRPFFLLAALHGAVLVPVWVAAVFGWLALPVEMEVSWHAHQMVYGFAAAGLAGFMLTAVPNWTGAPPLRRAPLAALALLWLVGRLAMSLTTVFPPRVAAGIDLAFLPALALGIIGPLLAARKPRNLMLLIPLSVFWIGDWMMQAQFTGIGEDTARHRVTYRD